MSKNKCNGSLKKIKVADVNRLLKWASRIPQVPDGQRGNVQVTSRTIPKGSEHIVVSFRNALLTGEQPFGVTLDTEFVLRSLKEDGVGTWMDGSLQELWQMREYIRRCKGAVLVGGLGLGITANLLAHKRTVDRVVVVEKNLDIIELVRPYLHEKVLLIRDEIGAYLATRPVAPLGFDWAIMDTWQGTGEWVWATEVVPLRRALRGRIAANRVLCWAESEMQGQLSRSLARAALANDTVRFGASGFYYEAFRRVAREIGFARGLWGKGDMAEIQKWADVEDAISDLGSASAFRYLIRVFFAVGTDEWEQVFGKTWDNCFQIENDPPSKEPTNDVDIECD